MPYNKLLTQRIEKILGEHPGLVEKKMFGGVGFTLHGNMACGVIGDELIVRVGSEQNETALALPHVRPFLSPSGGKPMAGWILVSREGWEADRDLIRWIEQGVQYAQTLPEKK